MLRRHQETVVISRLKAKIHSRHGLGVAILAGFPISSRAMKTTLLLLLAPLSLCASEFPTPYNSEHDTSSALPAVEAAAKMRLPPGFKATVFASEPDVQNPIAMAWD